MVGEYDLYELLKRYGINPANIQDFKMDRIIGYGEYQSIEKVLKYLRTFLSIKARRIEMCPSILYFGFENVRKNYEYLLGKGFNVLKLNNCLHILNCDPSELRETYEYLSNNYKKELRTLSSSLSCPLELIKDVERVAGEDLSKRGILSVSISCSLFSNEHMRDLESIDLDEISKIIAICKKHDINFQDGGMVFRKTASEIEKIVEVCKRVDLLLFLFVVRLFL